MKPAASDNQVTLASLLAAITSSPGTTAWSTSLQAAFVALDYQPTATAFFTGLQTAWPAAPWSDFTTALGGLTLAAGSPAFTAAQIAAAEAAATGELFLTLVTDLAGCTSSPAVAPSPWVTYLQQTFASVYYQPTAYTLFSALQNVWPAADWSLFTGALTGLTLADGTTFAFTSDEVTAANTLAAANLALATSLLIRDNLSDTGATSESPYWHSPDIICTEQDTLTIATAIADYANDSLNQSFLTGQSNNLYIRAKNIGSAAARWNVTLYYASASLLLTPQSWTQVSTPQTSLPLYDSSGSTTIQSNEYCLTDTPFTWGNIPAGHYCLIAIASANGILVTPPASFATNADQANWVQVNPNISQHNLFVQAASPTDVSFIATVGNNNSSVAGFVIQVALSAANPIGDGFPSGTTVAAVISDSRLSGGQYAPPAQTWSNQYGVDFPAVSMPATVDGSPGNPLMALTVTFTFPTGTTPTGTPIVSISWQQQVTTSSSALERKLARHDPRAALIAATGEQPSLMLMGMCTYKVTSS